MATFIGRLCFRHNRLALTVWLVLLVAGSITIAPVFQNLVGNPPLSGTQESQAQNAVKTYGNQGDQIVAVVDHISARAPQAQSEISQVVTSVRALPGIQQVSAPRIAANGQSAAITVSTTKTTGNAEHDAILAAVKKFNGLKTQLPGSAVLYGGGNEISNDTDNAIGADLERGEYVSLPITLVVLVFIFGGIAAAGVPLLAALATIAGSFGILLGFSKFLNMGHDVITVTTLLGLGLSIDYALLLVARYRDELGAGHEPEVAVQRAWRTAGRTVLFSGITITLALSGLLLLRVPRLQGMGLAGMSVAIVATLAALSLTAALLRIFGRRIKPARAKGAVARDPEAGRFARMVRGIQRAPALVAIGCLVVLAALAIPLGKATVKVVTLDGLPKSIQSVQVADLLSSQYGQNEEPAVQVFARTDPAALNAWAARWRANPEVAAVEPASALGPDLSQAVVDVRGAPQGPAAQALVAAMRSGQSTAGFQTWVTGDAATLVDLQARIAASLPAALAVTVAAMLLLLFLMSGSVVIPVKALLMNVVSLAATFGVLDGIFQHGWLSGALGGVITVGGLDPYVIVTVFAFAFALSMDYEVFLLSQIKEQRDRGHGNAAAIRLGLQRSGRVITSAALLMLIVFTTFALVAKVGQVQEIAFGLALAVLIDATLVRCLLTPAVLSILGGAAWWAPSPLRRLHNRLLAAEAVPETGKTLEPAGSRAGDSAVAG